MRKDEILEDLNTYCSTLEFIDRKTPFLEHADEEIDKYNKKIHKLTHRFKGVNFLLTWVVLSIICFIPMSMLNLIIDTEMNFIVFTPLVSIVALFLYKTKYEKSTLKMQVKAMKDMEEKADSDSKVIIGEINYAKAIADETLTKLMITKEENHEYDVLQCDDIYSNLSALYYVYGDICEPKTENGTLVPNFRNSIKHFNDIIEDVEKNNTSPELLKEFNDAGLRAQYRRGVMLRCAKLQNEEIKS